MIQNIALCYLKSALAASALQKIRSFTSCLYGFCKSRTSGVSLREHEEAPLFVQSV